MLGVIYAIINNNIIKQDGEIPNSDDDFALLKWNTFEAFN